MSMHKALHPRNDEDWLYVSRKEGRRRKLASFQYSIEASIQRIEDYVKKHKGRLIKYNTHKKKRKKNKKKTTVWTFQAKNKRKRECEHG